jgi:MFS family permease
MLTMPVCGALTDRIGPGKIVMSGIVVIVVGMAMFTQVGVDASDVVASGDSFAAGSPSYLYLVAALFIMGLGMGATMMPIMTAALQTLRDHEIARASTLMNITQQVAASIGTALFSVLLTNGFNSSDATTPTGIISDMTGSFAFCFLVATILVAACLIPAWFLPRSKPVRELDPAAVMGG